MSQDGNDSSTSQSLTLTYLEFYSGIGGWTCALKEAIEILNKSMEGASLSMHRLGAFDHSDLCNKVLHYNFPEPEAPQNAGKKPSDSSNRRKKIKKSSAATKPVSIESLTKEQLEEKGAMVWMMSPPCQPHTRQHTNQNEDMEDPRSKSFIHLCDMISVMDVQALPKIILLENVVGFENVSNASSFFNDTYFPCLTCGPNLYRRAIAVGNGERH